MKLVSFYFLLSILLFTRNSHISSITQIIFEALTTNYGNDGVTALDDVQLVDGTCEGMKQN